jgi:beta-lactamase class A
MLAIIAPLFLAIDPASLTAISRTADGHVGAAAEILESRKKILEFHANDPFPMQSVYKLPIAMAVLNEIDHGRLKLDQIVHVAKSDYLRAGQGSPLRDTHPEGADVSVRELMRLAVSESDGSASDVLLGLIGGPKTVTKYLWGLGVKKMVVRDTERRIGSDWSIQYENWATPAGAIELLRKVDQPLILKFMTDSMTGPGRIRAGLPRGTVLAHKTGTGGTRDGVTSATNDIGIITLPDGRHLAIAVFVADAKADEATRDAVIAKLAKAAWDEAVGAR